MLRERAVDLRELMDDPACDPARLAATLQRFDTVNRLISGWGTVYRRFIRPALTDARTTPRVLDLGCGGGDVVDRLARAAERDGLAVEWVGVDPDPRALEVARRRARPNVRFRTTDSDTLRREGERFDVVLSNHVLHHLDDEALQAFARDSLALSNGPVLHSDIERGALAFGLYAAGITPLAPGTFLRTDGLRSIRRSYRAAELSRALARTGTDRAQVWRIERPAPFRLLAVGHGHA